MAEEKRTTVIDFQVNETEAVSSLANTKKAIIDLKAQQQELNKAYKEGAVSLDQYAKESVQLEASLKKQQASYNTLQRTVTGLKNPFDKLNESIKNQAQSVTVAGVSLGQFATRGGALVATLGLLFKGYESSTIGAKDLTFASNQLSAAIGIVTNNMASLISGTEDGGGFFSKLAFAITAATSSFGTALDSAIIAKAKEELEDLGRAEISIRNDNNERLEENSVILGKIASEQTSIEEKTALTSEAIVNLRKNEEELIKIKQKQLSQLEFMLSMDKENERLQTQVLEKEKEISRVKSDTERKVQGLLKAEENLLEANEKKTEQEIENANKSKEKQLEADAKYFEEVNVLQLEHDIRQAERRQAEIDAENAKHDEMLAGMKAWLKNSEDIIKKRQDAFVKSEKTNTRIAALEQKQRMNEAILAFDALAGLFDKSTVAYKLATLTKLTLDTASAISSLTAASEANPANSFTFGGAGALQFALGLIRIFSNIGQASQLISQAAGGGTFMTKGPQLLLVGDNPGGVERVDVTPVSGRGKTVVGKNMVAMAGGGTMYTDAAIMANSRNMIPQQQAVTVNMVYSEFKEFQRSVQYKESLAEA